MKLIPVISLLPFVFLPGTLAAKEVLLNCQMGACFWADVLEKSELDQLQGKIRTVEARLKFLTTLHDGEYPDDYESSIPPKDVRETEATAICNREYPAMVDEDGTFTSLGLLESLGYEVSAASLYMLLCHESQYLTATTESLNALGYVKDNRVFFASVDELQARLGTKIIEGQTPFHFRVIDVASDDVLNIRSEPTASSQIVGKIPFDAELVEVSGVSADGKWSRVNAVEAVGWIRNRYLAPTMIEFLQDTSLPVGLVCLSEEPFSSIQISNDRLVFDTQNGSQSSLVIDEVVQSGSAWPIRELSVNDNGRPLTLIIEEETCQSAMVENYFPYRSYFQDAGDKKRYFGCCTLR